MNLMNEINNKDMEISVDNTFSLFIHELVSEFINYLTPNNTFKNDEWTVISAIIMQNNDQFKVICYANGTRCMPNKHYDENLKFKIKDAHAEVLCKKSFRVFIIKLLIFNFCLNFGINENFLQKHEFDNFNANKDFFDIFLFDDYFKKLKLKENIHFHLYISRPPCGECSISENEELTGSKKLEDLLNFFEKNIKLISEKERKFVRCKPIRSDASKEIISDSLSCSDKYALSNLLGIQGSMLSNLISPIYLSTITIPKANERMTDIFKGLNILERNIENKDLLREIKIKKFGFYFNFPKIMTVNNEIISFGNEKKLKICSFSSYWYFPKISITKIDPTSGLLSGTGKKDYNNPKCKVDICKNDLLFQYICLLKTYSQQNKFYNKHFINSIKILNEKNEFVDSNYKEIKNQIFKALNIDWILTELKTKIYKNNSNNNL